MTTAFSTLALIALLSVGCGGSRSGSVVISDVTKTNTLNLMSGYTGTGGDLPSGISLHVHGQIDGTAYVYAGNWDTTKLTGTVEWQIYRDWFETNCIFHYVPDSVRSGALTVDYTIH